MREPHTVLAIPNRIEGKGLIRKVKDLDGKNTIRIVITDRGRLAYQQSAPRDSIHKIMSRISMEERDQLRSLLETLLNKVDEEMGLPDPFLVAPLSDNT